MSPEHSGCRDLLEEEPRRLLPWHYLEDELSIGHDMGFVQVRETPAAALIFDLAKCEYKVCSLVLNTVGPLRFSLLVFSHIRACKEGTVYAIRLLFHDQNGSWIVHIHWQVLHVTTISPHNVNEISIKEL